MSERIDRPGVFKAKVSDWGVSTSKSGLPTFEVQYEATAYYSGGAWHDWTDYGQSLRGYHYPFKRVDGKEVPNETTIKQLMEVFGWNGLELDSLNTLDLGGWEVQITVKESEYQGQTRLQVAWINRPDAPVGQGIVKKDLGAQATQWNMMLRALNGKNAPAAPLKPPPKKRHPNSIAAGSSPLSQPPGDDEQMPFAKSKTTDDEVPF